MKKIKINKCKDGAWTEVVIHGDSVIIKQFDGDPKLDIIALTKDDFVKLGKIAEMLKTANEHLCDCCGREVEEPQNSHCDSCNEEYEEACDKEVA